jgi:hypothetical protein
MSFDKAAFLRWLETEVDGYYVDSERVEEEWPGFFENYEMIGVTSKYDPDTGSIMTPVRDYRQTIKYGQPLD